jgi:molecular chaperone DnaK
LDELIAEKLQDSIQSARETMEKASLNPNDIERIVFIGGPTHYKPLCDKVAFELGIAASADVNPMTAVAEGAAVFAESIDWDSQSRGRKNSRGTLGTNGQLDLSFNFIARTPSAKAKVAVKLGGKEISGAEFQVNNLDSGWDSGRMPLKNGATVDVTLSKLGDNIFKIFVFDAEGGPLNIGNNKIVITKTAATIDAIPASSSIGIEVSEKGRSELVYLVREGDPLPKKGVIPFEALESVRASSINLLNFKLWEGEIKDPVTSNRFIGELVIKGSDFDEGVISKGAKLICNYEVKDSGQINLEITVPSIGAAFPGDKNFYSRQEGQIDFLSASKQIAEEIDDVRGKVDSIATKVDDPKLDQALRKLDQASSIRDDETDPETAKQAMDNVQEARNLLADVRQSNKKLMRQMDLDSCLGFFNEVVRQHARATEASAFDNLARTAQRAIDSNGGDFKNHLNQLRQRNFEILWRQDWFVVDRFKLMAQEPWKFIDKGQHVELVALGVEAIKADDIEKLRHIMGQLYSIRISSGGDDNMIASTNIAKG